jgi:hypothetical protein
MLEAKIFLHMYITMHGSKNLEVFEVISAMVHDSAFPNFVCCLSRLRRGQTPVKYIICLH